MWIKNIGLNYICLNALKYSKIDVSNNKLQVAEMKGDFLGGAISVVSSGYTVWR